MEGDDGSYLDDRTRLNTATSLPLSPRALGVSAAMRAAAVPGEQQSNFQAVYEESLKKTRQERQRLEKQIQETHEELHKLVEERAKIQDDVRRTVDFYGTKGKKAMRDSIRRESANNINSGQTPEPAHKSILISTHTASTTPDSLRISTTKPDGPRLTNLPPKDSSTTEMLGTISAINKSYKKSLQELQSFRSQPPTPELAQLLLQRVNLIRKQTVELRWRLQTSDDETNFMNTLSEAVKICDSKVEVSTKKRRKGDDTETGDQNVQPPDGGKKKPKKTKGKEKGKGKTTKKGKTKKDGKGKKKKKKQDPKGEKKTKGTKRSSQPKAEEDGSKKTVESNVSSPTTNSVEGQREMKREEVLLKSYHEIAFEELQLDSSPLGNGAFGIVYKALWRGTEVAVKKLLVVKFNEEEVYNFKREAAFLERCSHHPNIVKFCGITSEFPNYAIITEFMAKGCIRDVLLREPNLPWKRIVSFAVDAAAGVMHLHYEKIIHRDLALRNLLVGEDWRVRLADFGLARMIPTETYAKTRGNIGAVRWLAPEVMKSHVYSEKSDAYAFGVVLWELCTKKEPFEEIESAFEVALKVMEQGLRPKIPSGCPPEYETIMKECWAQYEEDRPPFLEIHKRLKAYRDSLPD